MPIDAIIERITAYHGNNCLNLIKRPGGSGVGQTSLSFVDPPDNLSDLLGVHVRADASYLTLGDSDLVIAERDGYGRIVFEKHDYFFSAWEEYLRRNPGLVHGRAWQDARIAARPPTLRERPECSHAGEGPWLFTRLPFVRRFFPKRSPS